MTKKEKLYQRVQELTRQMEAAQDAIDSIEDSNKWEAADQRITAEFQPKIENLWKWILALQYPQPRDKWFCETFAPSFAAGSHLVSDKQAQIIRRHCETHDRHSLPGCIVDGRVFTLCNNRLYIEQLPTI